MYEDEHSSLFRESRWRLPGRLLMIGTTLLLIGLAGARALAGPQDKLSTPMAAVSAAVGASFFAWSIFRATCPVLAATVSEGSLSMRSRLLELGWQDRWQWRSFPKDRILGIEIGTRHDYPRGASYSDTAQYEFIVVSIANEPGELLRYAYAPLQRIANRDELIATLLRHPFLGQVVTLVGSLERT